MEEGERAREHFSPEEVKAAAEKFLEYVGYELQELSNIGFVTPDIRARRQTDKRPFEIIGLVLEDLQLENLEQALDGLAKLAAAKKNLGEQADYVLIFPPVSEFVMIEFLTFEKGKWYFEIKDEQFIIWLCNPARDTVTCLVGFPQDNSFADYFANLGKMNFDMFIGMRLSRELLAEEEF